MFSHGRVLSFLAIGMLLSPWAAAGETATRVIFDAPRTAPAIDVTASDCELGAQCGIVHQGSLSPHGGGRLIEIQLDVTTAIVAGRAENVGECRYFLEPSWPQATIVDYWPQTELESEAAGNVAVENKLEAADSAGLTFSGAFQNLLQAAGNASRGTKRNASESYQQLPPKKTVTASGTLRRQSAAYFRVVATPRSTLEGARCLKVVVRAPKGWRAGLMQVACRAAAAPSTVESSSVLREERFLVGVYLAGDEEAQSLAEAHASAEAQLRSFARAVSAPARENRSKSDAWRVLFLTTPSKPAIDSTNSPDPSHWLRSILFPIDASDAASTNAPAEARQAIERYRKARENLLLCEQGRL